MPRSSMGQCMQGNDGYDTHREELRFAYDFALPVGTPVLAAADGIVAAAVSGFRTGGRGHKENRVRANYVALRHGHGLYTRYYHLCHGGVSVVVGERVRAGQIIGKSGNTGFSGAPHLHFDVVDVLPIETATLHLAHPSGDRDVEESMDAVPLQCVASCFSGSVPPVDAPPITGRAVWAEPRTADAPLRNADASVRGAVVLIERCPHVDFLDKCERAEQAGAAAVVIVNYGRADPSELMTMGVPKAMRGEGRSILIPALFVSAIAGARVDAAMASAPPGQPPLLRVGRSPHFCARRESAPATLPVASMRWPAHTAQILKVTSDFVPLTQYARFLSPAHPEGYEPQPGEWPPPTVERVASAEPRDVVAGQCVPLTVVAEVAETGVG